MTWLCVKSTKQKEKQTKQNLNGIGDLQEIQIKMYLWLHIHPVLFQQYFPKKIGTLGLLYSSAFHGQLCIRPAHCDGSSQLLTWDLESSNKPRFTPVRCYLGRVNWGGKMHLLWVAAFPGWDPGVHPWGREVHSMSSVLCFMIVDVGNYPLELELK